MMRNTETEVYPGVSWRNHGPFCLASTGAILPTCRGLSLNLPLPVSEQLGKLLGYFRPFPGRLPKHDLSTWTVTDDWPEHISVTEAKVEVFERWCGDLFDELFGPAP